jgi:hypothetical protein
VHLVVSPMEVSVGSPTAIDQRFFEEWLRGTAISDATARALDNMKDDFDWRDNVAEEESEMEKVRKRLEYCITQGVEDQYTLFDMCEPYLIDYRTHLGNDNVVHFISQDCHRFLIEPFTPFDTPHSSLIAIIHYFLLLTHVCLFSRQFSLSF